VLCISYYLLLLTLLDYLPLFIYEHETVQKYTLWRSHRLAEVSLRTCFTYLLWCCIYVQFCVLVYFRPILLLWYKSFSAKKFSVAWCLTYCLGSFRGVQGSFEKFSGLYNDRPRGRSFSFWTNCLRKSVSLGSFHQFTAVNLVGDYFSRTIGYAADS